MIEIVSLYNGTPVVVAKFSDQLGWQGSPVALGKLNSEREILNTVQGHYLFARESTGLASRIVNAMGKHLAGQHNQYDHNPNKGLNPPEFNDKPDRNRDPNKVNDLVYRGISEEEALNIAKLGYIKSDGRWSVPEEGTPLGQDYYQAESYANFGRTAPTKDKPNYVIEIHSGNDMFVDRRDDYVKSHAKISSDRITRAWKFYNRNNPIPVKLVDGKWVEISEKHYPGQHNQLDHDPTPNYDATPQEPNDRQAAQPTTTQVSQEPPADPEYVKRAREIESSIKTYLDQGKDTMSVFDRVNGVEGMYTPERRKQHEQIIDDIMRSNEHVKSEKRAAITGGLMGAGKTTTLKSDAGKNSANIDTNEYITINPDDIKNELINRGMIPDYPGLKPGEAAWLMHDESSKLAWDLHHRAVAQGKNVIWDISMSSTSGVERRMNRLMDNGYKVRLVFVDTTIDTAVKRAEKRHRIEKDGRLARYTSEKVIRSQTDSQFGSKNRKVFEEIKSKANDGWYLFDNNNQTKLVEAWQ
jgi:hypothetical protein